MKKKTYSIVVTYYPIKEDLERLCKILLVNSSVIIVDNTPGCKEALLKKNNCTWISNEENLGIAKAQNIGIREALRDGASAIALFDQDSLPDVQMLPSLVAFLGLPNCGVIAPLCIDIRTNREYPPFVFNRWGYAKCKKVNGHKKLIVADLIISSGSVIDSRVFDYVGFMNEDLFIDFVDLEWCIRCREAGIPIKILPNVLMYHSIGDKVVRNGPLTTFVHSPIRAYYRIRNPLLLLRMPHVPRLYVLHGIFSALVHHLLQWKYSKDSREHLRMGWLGFTHGIRGINGKLEI